MKPQHRRHKLEQGWVDGLAKDGRFPPLGWDATGVQVQSRPADVAVRGRCLIQALRVVDQARATKSRSPVEPQ